MPSSSTVQIDIRSEVDDPLVAVFEANIDAEHVTVHHTSIAAKAILPVDIVIETTAVYLFEKFVLDPLIEPIVERFNWVNAAKKFLHPIQDFNLVVRINHAEFIEASISSNHDITAQIWKVIRKSIDILRTQNLIDQVSKIRFTSTDEGKLLVLCYRENRPFWNLDLDEGRITQIPQGQAQDPDALSDEEIFYQAVLKRSEAYRRFLKERENKQ